MLKPVIEFIVAFILLVIFSVVMIHLWTRPGFRNWIGKQTAAPAMAAEVQQNNQSTTLLAEAIEEMRRANRKDMYIQQLVDSLRQTVVQVVDTLEEIPGETMKRDFDLGSILVHGENMTDAEALDLVQRMRADRINARRSEENGKWCVWSGVYLGPAHALKVQKQIQKKGYMAE